MPLTETPRRPTLPILERFLWAAVSRSPGSFSIASLGLKTPEGQAIAIAAQKFGFIVVDRGGSGITLRVQPNTPNQDAALHMWNSQLQADLNAIFANVQQVQFPIATYP